MRTPFSYRTGFSFEQDFPFPAGNKGWEGLKHRGCFPPPSKKFGHSVFSWRQAHSVIALAYYSTLLNLSFPVIVPATILSFGSKNTVALVILSSPPPHSTLNRHTQ